MTELETLDRIERLKLSISYEIGRLESLTEQLARLKAAAPVKRPVIALVPCKWEEADGHPGYGHLRLGFHKEGCTGFAGKLDDNFYPVRRVELCTDPGEIRHWIKESGHAFTVENILKAIGL